MRSFFKNIFLISYSIFALVSIVAFVCLGNLAFADSRMLGGASQDSIYGRDSIYNQDSITRQDSNNREDPSDKQDFATQISRDSKAQNIKPVSIKTHSQNEKIIGGIALFVNNEPITIYSITKAQRALNTDKIRATDALIMEKLKDSEIKRLKIDVSESQVDEQIAQIARQNNMDLSQFYSAVMKGGMSLSDYRAKLKEQILTQELMRKILFSSNVGQEDELRKYYNEHQNEFVVPKKVDVIKYVSKDKNALEEMIKSKKDHQGDNKNMVENVSQNIPQSVSSKKQILDIDGLETQIADVMIATNKGSFTQILQTQDNEYVTFFINDKLETKQIDFNQAKNYIAQKLIISNQEKILHDYFERVRDGAKIELIR